MNPRTFDFEAAKRALEEEMKLPSMDVIERAEDALRNASVMCVNRIVAIALHDPDSKTALKAAIYVTDRVLPPNTGETDVARDLIRRLMADSNKNEAVTTD